MCQWLCYALHHPPSTQSRECSRCSTHASREESQIGGLVALPLLQVPGATRDPAGELDATSSLPPCFLPRRHHVSALLRAAPLHSLGWLSVPVRLCCMLALRGPLLSRPDMQLLRCTAHCDDGLDFQRGHALRRADCSSDSNITALITRVCEAKRGGRGTCPAVVVSASHHMVKASLRPPDAFHSSRPFLSF